MSRNKERKKWRQRRRALPKSFCQIYGLCGSDGKVRYIGQTRLLLTERLRWYYKQIERKIARHQRFSPVESWIDNLKFFGIEPQILLIDGNATWDISEILYIERFKNAGHELLNVTRGGNDDIGNIAREAKKLSV